MLHAVNNPFPRHSRVICITWLWLYDARENGGYPVERRNGDDNNNRRGSAGPIYSDGIFPYGMLEKRRARMFGEKRWREATRNFSSGILAALNGTSADGHRGKMYIQGRDIR